MSGKKNDILRLKLKFDTGEWLHFEPGHMTCTESTDDIHHPVHKSHDPGQGQGTVGLPA